MKTLKGIVTIPKDKSIRQRLEIIADVFGAPQRQERVIYCEGSATKARLYTGAMAAADCDSAILGDDYLTKRPMDRVVEPLRQMGACVNAVDGHLPIAIVGGQYLKGITYKVPVPSAQVKSAVLLAGLRASGETTVIESVSTRNHTENILKEFGADITVKEGVITVRESNLKIKELEVPGDFSSAAFFIVAALLLPGSDITIKQVGINETRTGLLDIIKMMLGDEIYAKCIEITNIREAYYGEKIADIRVRSFMSSSLDGQENYAVKQNKKLPNCLNATRVESPSLIVRTIDELLLVAVLGAFASGKTVVRNASELRIKESDRIAAIVENFKARGIEATEFEDGFEIEGSPELQAAPPKTQTYGDHRVAMSLSVLDLALGYDIVEYEEAKVSFSDFYKELKERLS